MYQLYEPLQTFIMLEEHINRIDYSKLQIQPQQIQYSIHQLQACLTVSDPPCPWHFERALKLSA